MSDLVTGPGRYPRRDGGIVVILRRNEDPQVAPYEWIGDLEDDPDFGALLANWMPTGRYWPDGAEDDWDIIGPRIEDHPHA